MARNTSVTLGEHFEAFIEEQITEGRFGSVSEIVCAGLRLLEEHKNKLALMRVELQKGETSPSLPDRAEQFQWLATNPHAGKERMDIKTGYFTFPHRRFYS